MTTGKVPYIKAEVLTREADGIKRLHLSVLLKPDNKIEEFLVSVEAKNGKSSSLLHRVYSSIFFYSVNSFYKVSLYFIQSWFS